ncbi:lamin tail domain-containing protein [Streptomyces sp. NPDC093260]|uniref:lamin tail domain-containing protein n=1 Tax=Streptomyces sp. NPDC093260 TaxID=3155073 RepID=UPI003424DC49
MRGILVTVSTAVRGLTAAALTAAAVTASVAVPASAADHRAPRPSVQISRVQADSPGRDDRSTRSLNAEWVEITNTTRKTVNLNGWTLSDQDGHTYTFHHYRLDGRSTVRVHTGTGRDARHDLYQDRRAYVWNNSFDTATLRNEHHRFVDSRFWGHRHH